jgi:high-affinity iron transporter
MVLIDAGARLLMAVALLGQQPQADGDQVRVVRRVATTAQLAAQEYRVGVQDGRVVAKAEVDEAKLFLAEARRSAELLSADAGAEAIRQIDGLAGLVDATANPDTLDARVRALTGSLATRLGVALEDIPAEAPSLARGAQVYRENCVSCHGNLGRGDGPEAASLEPKPASLADAATLRDRSPLDF